MGVPSRSVFVSGTSHLEDLYVDFHGGENPRVFHQWV